MNQYSKIEDNKIQIKELKKFIEDWNIKERIRQKIAVWSIRRTDKKISEIPINFITAAFVFYFLREYRQSVQNYHQNLLMASIYQLKNIYNEICYTFFKKQDNFEYTLVILSKVLTYFIASYFPKRKITPSVTESTIYMTIVALLIGYQVESNAYLIIQNKFRTKNARVKRTDSIIGEVLVNEEINQIKEIKQKANKKSGKKIHRKGIQNLFKYDEQEKGMETFRMQVREALQVKNNLSLKNQNIIQSEHHSPHNQYISDQSQQWLKGKSRVLNINQVSAALSINTGLDSNHKCTSHIHLSKRKKMKQFRLDKIQKAENLERVTVPVFHEMTFKTNSKDWSTIIEEMKNSHRQNFQTKDSFARETKSNGQLTLLRKNPANIFKQIVQDTNSSYILIKSKKDDCGQFKKMNSDLDQTIQCKLDELKEQSNKKIDKLARKSSSIFFTHGRQQFQKDCRQRKLVLISPELFQLPKIDKI